MNPDLYEMSTLGNDFSAAFRGACACFKDKLIHFKDCTIEEEIMKMQGKAECPFRKYECEKLQNLKVHVSKGQNMLLTAMAAAKEGEQMKITEMQNTAIDLLKMVSDCQTAMNSDDVETSVEMLHILLSKCDQVVQLIASFNLPLLKPRILEQTDAGPSVGVSNKQVLYRAAERVRIEGCDYYARIHRATGDCQNPVERTQASVGKAIGNGNRIYWEYRKMFEGLSENDKENMTLEEFTRYEDERQKFNVFKTCAELAGRVNDSPGPGGTLNPMIGIVCEVPEELFYWDSEYLNAYLGASQSKKQVFLATPTIQR